MAYKDVKKQRHFQKLWQRQQRLERRKKVIAQLGCRCVDCGNDDFRVLQLDHVIPLKRDKHSDKRLTTGGNLVCLILRKNLQGIVLRCANCHQIKTFEDRKQFRNYIG